MSHGNTALMSCFFTDCRFNRNEDCILKEISLSEDGVCLLKELSEVQHINVTHIVTNPDLFDRTELKTPDGRWIFVHFQHLKKDMVFRILKNGTPVEINDVVEFEALEDACLVKGNVYEKDKYQIRIL